MLQGIVSHVASFHTLGAIEPEALSAMVPIRGAVCVLATAAGTEDVPCDCTAGNSQVVTKRSREYTVSNYSHIVPDSRKWRIYLQY